MHCPHPSLAWTHRSLLTVPPASALSYLYSSLKRDAVNRQIKFGHTSAQISQRFLILRAETSVISRASKDLCDETRDFSLPWSFPLSLLLHSLLPSHRSPQQTHWVSAFHGLCTCLPLCPECSPSALPALMSHFLLVVIRLVISAEYYLGTVRGIWRQKGVAGWRCHVEILRVRFSFGSKVQ